MADKSKLPDLKEITGMAGKLFKDVKQSVSEIVNDYKAKHPGDNDTEKENTSQETKADNIKQDPTTDENKSEDSSPKETKPEVNEKENEQDK
jgi:Sec-independent protein translocase protein TatA